MAKKVLIIGAGASGLMAAIAAAEQGAETTVLEKERQAGKKLLSTGNGHCNFSNRNLTVDAYHCVDPVFVETVLSAYSVYDTIDFFRACGMPEQEVDGRIYPLSGEAKQVRDLLCLEAEHRGARIRLNTAACSIERQQNRFRVAVDSGYTYEADAVILAGGSPAGPKQQSAPDAYSLAESLGHHLISPTPALVQLVSDDPCFTELAGIRTHAKITVINETADNQILAEETGELQLTDYGLSGIPIFQLSWICGERLAARDRLTAVVDFLPTVPVQTLLSSLQDRIKHIGYRPSGSFFLGMLPQKLVPVILKRISIDPAAPADTITLSRWEETIRTLKAFSVNLTGTRGNLEAQVMHGGVRSDEINPHDLSSRICKELYLCGEVLDVDGRCGGYNLQWAFSSGCIAGLHAALPVFNKKL